MMSDEIRPASEADLVTFQQWNQSMLTHPRLATRTVVESLLARVEFDRATIISEGARADQYEAESEQKGGNLMAAEGIIEDHVATIAALEKQMAENVAIYDELRERMNLSNARLPELSRHILGMVQSLATARAQIAVLREAAVKAAVLIMRGCPGQAYDQLSIILAASATRADAEARR